VKLEVEELGFDDDVLDEEGDDVDELDGVDEDGWELLAEGAGEIDDNENIKAEVEQS